MVFKANGQLDGRFLAAVMKLPTVREQIETRLTGTSPTMKNISKPALLDLRFPVPDLATQQALVDAMVQQVKAVESRALEAGELRRSAWAAFESALFEPHEKSS